ncbi:MAG TPA: NAD(P)H-binding protein [Nitriliruptorales bacterium]
MPVLVTRAHTTLGQLTVARVLRSGGEVRAFVTGAVDVQALRGAGAIVASGDLLDEGHLEAAMEQVHTVVHLGRGLLAPSADLVVEEAATVLTAALGAGVQRLITTSAPGAAPGVMDRFRAALGEVEQLFATAPLPSVALRTSLVDTPALRDALAGVRSPASTLATEVAPVRVEDVVEALWFLDDIRATAHEGHVVLAAPGPERMSIADYLDRAGVGAPGAVGRLVGRVWRDPATQPLLAGGLPGPWVPEAEWPSVWELAGIEPQPVAA